MTAEAVRMYVSPGEVARPRALDPEKWDRFIRDGMIVVVK